MEAVEAAFALACLQEVPAQYEQARGLGLLGRRVTGHGMAPPRILPPPRVSQGGVRGDRSSMGGGARVSAPGGSMGGSIMGGSSSMGGGARVSSPGSSMGGSSGLLRQPSAPPQPAGRPAACVVCLDAPRDCVLLPCGHTCLCLACAGLALRQPGRPGVCPICRGGVTSYNKIFLS
jgi:hypothetical protein